MAVSGKLPPFWGLYDLGSEGPFWGVKFWGSLRGIPWGEPPAPDGGARPGKGRGNGSGWFYIRKPIQNLPKINPNHNPQSSQIHGNPCAMCAMCAMDGRTEQSPHSYLELSEEPRTSKSRAADPEA